MLCYREKIDSCDLKDLRTIFILGSEANNTYKRVGREATGAAIDHRVISPEKNIRPNFSAVACGINRILVFNYQSYLQQNFSLDCSDLKIGCDKNVHSAAS